MRLVGYYALHTLKNQIRKLMKTWVLIFLLICFAVGVGIGIFAGVVEDNAPEPDYPDNGVMLPEEPGEPEDWDPDLEDPENPDTDIVIENLEEVDGQFLEALGGVLLLGVLVFYAFGADKAGSQIFLPADVNLLFASPMKPQSVLLFRLSSRLGMTVLMSLYLLFQLPNMVLNGGLPLWGCVALVLAWTMLNVYGLLLQVMLYTICSTHSAVKKYLRPAIYAILGVLVLGLLAYRQSIGGDWLTAVAQYFGSPATRWIPVWGWVRAFCVFAMDGNVLFSVLTALALLAGMALMVFVIWRLKADFYEEAMAKSEETAELLAQVQSDKSTGIVVKRKKDRSEKLRRDSFNHGSGANVFFFKAMYNRFRFAFLGCITKTMVFYLVVAVIAAILAKDMMVVSLALGVMVFYRALGNPLEADTGNDTFRMVPESAWAKVFWSLLGGIANCLLDILPAVIVGAVITRTNPLIALAWIPLIVSVDYLSTTVGSFINLSVPVSAGTTVKQLVQVLFIYFGLLPDIVIAALAIVFDYLFLGMAAITAVNLFLGTLFFGVTPIFVDAKGGRRPKVDVPFTGDLTVARKAFSRVGLGLFAAIVSATVLQLIIAALISNLFADGEAPAWLLWVATFVPMYFVAMPLCYLILRKVPANPPEVRPAKPVRLAMDGAISFFLMYAGNIVGILVLLLIQSIFPATAAENPLATYAYSDSLVFQILVMVILAPLFEEFIFRKQIIDRVRVYGEKTAVVVSALLFGLFHGNFSQFFYAAALGLVFGYLYLKTGRLRYSIGLHMLVNFIGSIVAPAIVRTVPEEIMIGGDPDAAAILTGMLPLLIYLLVIFMVFLAGLVLFCIGTHNLAFQTAEVELPRRQRGRTVFRNAGMILFFLAAAALFVISVVPL